MKLKLSEFDGQMTSFFFLLWIPVESQLSIFVCLIDYTLWSKIWLSYYKTFCSTLLGLAFWNVSYWWLASVIISSILKFEKQRWIWTLSNTKDVSNVFPSIYWLYFLLSWNMTAYCKLFLTLNFRQLTIAIKIASSMRL